MADVHVGGAGGLARRPGGVTMMSGSTDPPPVDDGDGRCGSLNLDDRHHPEGTGETTVVAAEAEAMTPPRSGSSSRRITTQLGGGWTTSSSISQSSSPVRSRSVVVGAVPQPQPPQSQSRGMDDDREAGFGGDDSAAANTTATGEADPPTLRPPMEDVGDDETVTGEKNDDDVAGPSITIEGGLPVLNQDTDPPNVRPPEEEERDAALLLEAEVLRLRLDEMCRALRLLTRQVSRFPAPVSSGKDPTGSTATDGDGDAGRRRPSAAAAAPSSGPAGRRRPEIAEDDDGALRERTNAASDVNDGSGSGSGNRERQKLRGGDAVETKDGEEREMTPKAANGRPKKKSPSIRLLTSPMGKFKKSKASPLPPPPPPPFSAPPVPTSSSESSSRRSMSHAEDYDDDYLALDREVELCLHLLQCDDEGLLLRHRRRRKQAEPAVGEDDVAATTQPRGYAELSNLRNACLRMRECLRQTSVESDAALSEVRRLRDESVASRRRTVDLERAVCRLHRENAALRSRVARDRRERRNVLRALRDYVSNVKSKRRMLEEEVTRTNVLMHEWALGGRMGGGGAGDGVPSSPGGALLAESSPARSSSSVAGDDEDLSSEVSFCSSVSSLATSSSSVASSRSRVTDEGVAAVRLFEQASESSASGGDPCSAAASAKEKFRKRRMLHAAAAAGEGRPVYRLTFARGEKIGLQFQRVAIASIPRDVLVGGVEHTEKEGGGLGEAERAEAGESHSDANPDGEGTSQHQEEDDWFQEDDGPWPMPRSRTSTLDDGPRSRTSTLDDVCVPRSRASTLEEHDAADLLAAVAAASSSSASLDHGHDGHRCQQQRPQQRCQQPALDAFLVCGYRGFVDRGAGSCHPPTRRRPTLGARLIAVNGESLEVGHWTFEDLRATLQAHMAADADHVVELTFRNDQLTKRQKELLNRAVAEVEMSRSTSGGWTGTMNHVEYRHHPYPPRGNERRETSDHRLEDDGGSRGGKDGVRDRMRKFSEELFKSSADDDANGETSTALPPAGASVEREEHRTTRERMRKFSEELFKTSPEDESKKERAAHIPQAAPSTPSEKESHKASSGADSVKEKMMDLFKSSSGSSSNDLDDAKKDPSITASLFETPKKDEGGGSQGSSSDSVKEKMRKFSEGLSSTFKQLDEESRRDKTHHADSVEKIPAQGEGKESALKAKMPNFEFSPKFKKFF